MKILAYRMFGMHQKLDKLAVTGEASHDKRITEGHLCLLRSTFWECVLRELMIVLPQQTENK